MSSFIPQISTEFDEFELDLVVNVWLNEPNIDFELFTSLDSVHRYDLSARPHTMSTKMRQEIKTRLAEITDPCAQQLLELARVPGGNREAFDRLISLIDGTIMPRNKQHATQTYQYYTGAPFIFPKDWNRIVYRNNPEASSLDDFCFNRMNLTDREVVMMTARALRTSELSDAHGDVIFLFELFLEQPEMGYPWAQLVGSMHVGMIRELLEKAESKKDAVYEKEVAARHTRH